MNKTLAITTITLVAVVMGLSAIAPMMQYAEASHPISEKACEALRSIPDPSPAVQQLIVEHCGPTTTCPPDCGFGKVGSTIF